MRKVGPKGIALIQQFESYAKAMADGGCAAYPDPASGGDPWTIGWGSTGPDIKCGTFWTRKQCEDRFAQHLQKFADGVTAAIGSSVTTQNQFDALCSFAYNLGVGNLLSSTLLKRHRAGDHVGAQRQFAVWNRAGGRVMAGLTKRRAAEAALYGAEA